MDLFFRSRFEIETMPLPGPSAVICMADAADQLAPIKDQANVVARLNLIFNDTDSAFQIVQPPKIQHAQEILNFVTQHADVPNLVAQCQVGVGRSQGVIAALNKIYGADPNPILSRGTYNRTMYRTLLAAAGMAPDPEPLMSISVRVKYAPDRLLLFLLCMRRQRHENWEVIAVTDGPNPAVAKLVAEFNDPRVRLIQTEKPLGRWGHPYRQIGLSACRGEFIGMSNDDNYYVPGYLEQMRWALKDADLVSCLMLHSYTAWHIAPAEADVGCWIARASLVRQVPWQGSDFLYDGEYFRRLVATASRVTTIDKPLFIHN
jgi:hypothetical protein